MTTSIHDIKVGDKTYILEWTKDNNGQGYIAITETCQEVNQDVANCEHETFDFKEVN